MDNENKTKQAKAVFETLCGALEKNEWHYEKDVERLRIECGAQGDDLPIQIKVTVYEDRMLVVLLSLLPFTVPEDKRLESAAAVSIVNNKLVDGSFDYDIKTGHMFFRMTNSFIESLIGEEVFTYMLFCSCRTIDDFNDKFLMLAKGLMTLDQFIESVNE